MSAWPLSFDHNNNLLPITPKFELFTLPLSKLWSQAETQLETFVKLHLFITTAYHFLGMGYLLINKYIDPQGHLCFRDAATLSWISDLGDIDGLDWHKQIHIWSTQMCQAEREFEMVSHISITISNKS